MHRQWAAVLVVTMFAGCAENSLPGLSTPVADDDAEARLSLSDAELIAIPDSEVTLAVWRSQGAYAVKRGQSDFSPATRTRYELMFRGGESRDPTVQRVRGESSLYLVQFYGVALPEMIAPLVKAGGEAVAPFPLHAYVMRLPEGALSFARKARFVRAIEPFEARHRFELGGTGRYLIRPSSERSEVRGALIAELNALGATVHLATANHYLLEATMSAQQVAQAAELGEVLHIDPWSAPEADMDKVRIISGANFLEETLGFTGTGVRGEVMDTNVFDQHPDLKNRGILFHGPHSGDLSHGTPTTGIVFGDGSANPAARGLMPTAQPIFASYEPFLRETGDRHAHTTELTRPPYEAVFQSNSWGSSLTTNYTNLSAEMDTIVFDLDFLIFNSMSNSGDQSVRPQAWAKNVVSIGGVKHFDTLDTADDKWAEGGSIGPASDGRLKPDLAHFWDLTLAPSGTGKYTQFGGTSGATPITAGYAGLFMQMWSAGVFGNPTPGATVFANRPHFSTAKAMLINSATQWYFTGATHDLTRTHQGWGRVDVKRLYELRNSFFIINETELLTQSQTRRYELTVPAGSPALRATLTWADPAGVPSAGLHRVNDLTLKVTAPDGTVYFGNNGLELGLFSKSGGVANIKDTVENVFVETPATGTWLVEVRADEIAKDGHLETPEVDADFALVVSGIERVDSNAPPTVKITSPVSGATVAGEVVVQASAASWSSTIAKVRFGLPDGTSVDDETEPYEVRFDSKRVINGPAAFTAIATAADKTTSTLATAEVTVENLMNQRPVVSLSVPAGELHGTVTFRAMASDPETAVKSVRFSLPDGTSVELAAAPYTVDFNTELVANGTYTVSAIATDDQGQDSLTSTASVVINHLLDCADGRVHATGLPLKIPDNNKLGIDVPLVVVGKGTLSALSISLEINHSYRGDLIVKLTSPSGHSVDLTRRVGGPADDFVLGNFALTAFSGPAEGTWLLNVADVAVIDSGSVNTASLMVKTDCRP